MESRLAISNMKKIKKLEEENKKLKKETAKLRKDISYLMRNKGDRKDNTINLGWPRLHSY